MAELIAQSSASTAVASLVGALIGLTLALWYIRRDRRRRRGS